MTAQEDKSYGVIVTTKSKPHKILLIKHAFGGRWAFPKGHSEGSETGLEAAIRETVEETGFEIKKEQIVTDWQASESFGFVRAGFKINKTVYYFLALVDEDAFPLEPQVPAEVKDLDLFTFYDASKMLRFDNARNMVEEVKEYLRVYGKKHGIE